MSASALLEPGKVYRLALKSGDYYYGRCTEVSAGSSFFVSDGIPQSFPDSYVDHICEMAPKTIEMGGKPFSMSVEIEGPGKDALLDLMTSAAEEAHPGETGGGWSCPTCGSTDIPKRFRRVRSEWEELSEREQDVARHLLVGVSLYGAPDWVGANDFWDAVRALLPSIGDIETDELSAALPLFPEDD